MKTLALICCMIVLSAVASAQSLPQMIAQEKAYSVNDLIQQLRSQDANIRAFAADTLARMGAEAKEAVPALTAALKDQDSSVRASAAESLRYMASALFDSGSTEILPELKVAYKALKDHTDPEVKSNADDVQRTIDYLEFLWWGKVGQHAVKLINEHHYVCIGTATFLLLQITWLLIFWRRPYWLLRISESIHKANQTLTSKFP